MSDKATYGYLAGLLDGEGHITISRGVYTKKYTRKDGTAKKQWHFMINIGITNTNVKLMHWLKERIGGTFYPLKSDKRNPNWKPSYKWQYTKQADAERLLLAVMPYLLLKKEQAKVLLEFIRLNGEYNPNKRQEFYEKMISLNRRGISVETNTQDTIKPVMIESDLISDNKSAPMVT